MNKIENSELLCAFGEWIREAREHKDLTQAEVGQIVGLHQTYYGKIELGKRVVDFVTAINICKALGLDISDFIKTYIK